MEGVRLVDLNGRELEVRTADGKLMTTVIAALDTHRSDLYSEKTLRHMRAAREKGLPVRSKIPFGLRKIRNESGRFVAVEVDPITGPAARQRIDWYLEGASQSEIIRRCMVQQPEHPISVRNFAAWLRNPMLTGRYCWGQNKDYSFREVVPEPSFTGLITDAEHERIKVLLAAASTHQGLRGRETRLLTSLVRCKECGTCLTYKQFPKAKVVYLRCCNSKCPKKSKAINVEQVFTVLQYSVARHAEALVPVLSQPRTDPPEVLRIRQQIELLQTVDGAEDLIEQKRGQIRELLARDTELPAWLTVAAVRSVQFWLQDDQKLNSLLRTMLETVTVDLHQGVRTAEITSVRFRTSPAEAELPADQRNVLIPKTRSDLLLEIEHHGGLAEAVELLMA